MVVANITDLNSSLHQSNQRQRQSSSTRTNSATNSLTSNNLNLSIQSGLNFNIANVAKSFREKLTLPTNKFQLIDENIISSLKKNEGLKNLLEPELVNEIDTTTIGGELENVPTKDLLFEENTRSTDFVQKNLEFIISNENKNFQTIELPNVLSHEIIKLKNNYTFETNESSLFPSLIYALKKEYYESIQVPISNRYFLNSQDNKILRESYVENLNETKKSIDNLYDNVEKILTESELVSAENNFANKMVNFYLNENISSSIGKVASIILDNDSIDFLNVDKNFKESNESLNKFFYNGIKENFRFLQEDDNLSKVFEIISSINNANSSYIKDANENKQILNTDRLVGQNFLNLSLSLDGFFKDSISHSYWNKKCNNSQRGGFLNNLIDSKEFLSIPIIKLDSILSIENNTDSLFNNFNNDIMNSLGENVFNILDDEFSSESLMMDESETNYLNYSVYNTFNSGLFLTNKLPTRPNQSSIITIPVFSSQVPEIVKIKERFAAGIYYSNIVKGFFNPMNLPSIQIKTERKELIVENSRSDGGDYFMTTTRDGATGLANASSFDTDINFIYHNLEENANLLRTTVDKDGNKVSLNNNAKEILSGTKFLFFAGKSINSKSNVISLTNAEEFDDIQAGGYNISKIKYVCLDTSRQFVSGQQSEEQNFIREFIKPINIDIIQSAKRKFYTDTAHYNEFYSDRKIEIAAGENDLEDYNLKNSLLKFFKAESRESFNGRPFNSGYDGLIDFFNNNKQIINFSKGFVLFENTQNTLNMERISDKFILYDSSLTNKNEFLNDRVLKSSASYNQSKEENTDLLMQDLKQKSFSKNWLNISFNIRNNLYKLKERKLKRLNENLVLDFLKSIKLKAKKIKLRNKNTPYLTLLYSKDSENAIDDFSSSPFLFESGNQETFNKFDFSETKSELKNTLDFLINNNENNEIERFPLSSDDLKQFLSYYYTDSELKNSSTLLKYFYSGVIRCLSAHASSEQAYHDIIYDKLLADSLLNDGASDVVLSIIISTLMIRKNISSENSFEEMNKKTQNAYKSYLEKIYSYQNIQKQKSYTLRTVAFPNINCSLYPNEKDTSASYNNAGMTFGPVRGNYVDFKEHSFNFGVMPGQIISYCFPFHINTWTTNLEDESTEDSSKTTYECCAYETVDGDLVIADAQKFRYEGGFSNCESLYEFVVSNFYNYDAYIDTSVLSRGENNSVSSSAFNQEDNKFYLANITLKEKMKSRHSELNKETDYRNLLTSFTQTLNSLESSEPKTYENNLSGNWLCYKLHASAFEDYCLRRIEHQPVFKNFINKFVIEVLKFLDASFDENIDKIDTIEEVTKYAKTFTSEINLITNLLEFPASLFSIYYDTIIEGSIYKSIPIHLNRDETTVATFSDMWNKEIFDLINIEDLLTNNISFEKKKKKEEDFPNKLFMKLHADIVNIEKVLNNSDIAEIMSFDVMSSYLVEFERSINNFEKFSQTRDRIIKIEDDLDLNNISNDLFNRTKLNLLSKKLNDYSYFQAGEYEKINQIINADFSIDLKDHFETIIQKNSSNELEMFFSTLLKREKNKSILAEQATALLNLTNNRYDIIRFGIDYNLAENLLDNKILKIKCHITNHKYPNIFIPPIYYFYTPVLTEVTPSHLTILEQSRQFDDGIAIDDFVGIYDFSQKDLKQRYNVVHKGVAIVNIMQNLLSNVNSERLLRGENNLLADIGPQGFNSALKIVVDAILSNAVKYSNFKSQKNIDESNIKNSDNEITILGSLASTLFETMTEKDFEETFLESYQKTTQFFEEEEDLNGKINIVKNKAHFIEFFNTISEFTDKNKVSSIFDENRFFDVFSIVIGRDEIRRQIESFYSEDDANFAFVERLMNEESFFDSFSYIIESEVV
jgi:hypothetical protein